MYFLISTGHRVNAEHLYRDEGVKSMLTQIAEQIEERGIQKGMQKKARENALKMKNREFSVKDIAEITGLTVEEIQNL